MSLSTIKTPGVYLDEVNAFTNPIEPVPTAVPAFIGYTPQAMYNGKSYTNVPTRITSFEDFQAIFCYPNPPAPADPAKQYNPQYYLVKQESQPEKEDYLLIEGNYYTIVPDPNSIYHLYNSVRLFYDNGGGNAYIVSVGTYGPLSGKPMETGKHIVNPNVQLDELKNGLALLKNESEPTMYICPEATLLSVDDNANLMQAMLLQNLEIKTVISIFDIIGGRNPDPMMYMDDITTFRNNTGTQGLKYGAAYYPFIETTIMQPNDIDYTNLFGGDVKQLEPLLSPDSNPDETIKTIIANIQNPSDDSLTVSQYNKSLTGVSPVYNKIITHVLNNANILPPSGGIAGVITNIDHQIGPWKAPANISIERVVNLPIRLSESQQENLNIDAVSGKSINALRFFNGLGILIWGARTLDGNSQDWRYISVLRTTMYLEKTCKLAIQAYVFKPNVKNTWETVKAVIGSFLSNVWKQGGLVGASASDAFSVECGLGETMTAEDILNGYMNVTVKVAIVRPAEFIVLTFQQQMETSG